MKYKKICDKIIFIQKYKNKRTGRLKVEAFDKDIYLEICYRILSSTQDEDITDIRKKFYYKLSYLEEYWIYIHEYYMDKKKSIDSDECICDLRNCEKYIHLVCDSYLAILLYQFHRKEYLSVLKSIHVSLPSSFEKTKIAILETELNQNKEEIVMSNHRYIGNLIIYSNFWADLPLSSLNAIVGLERQMLSFADVVSCYMYTKRPKYQENLFTLIKK